MELADVRDLAARIRSQASRVVVGQQAAVDLLLVALLAEGHALLEGMPGTAKTLLARTFAASLSLEFGRVQFTPDLMPGDILGTNLFDFATRQFVLTRGPIFTQVLLADEINRTPPKTQAALLQAMQERHVTIDGRTFELPAGFLVIATQNPIEHEGTYPLPEAQLDRFLVRIRIDYPDREREREMVRIHGGSAGMPRLEDLHLEPVADLQAVLQARRLVSGLAVAEPLLDYAVDLVRATREHPALLAGASPRACNMLCMASRAAAILDGRDYVLPDDIKRLAPAVLEHRLVLAPAAELEGQRAGEVLAQILAQLPAPR